MREVNKETPSCRCSSVWASQCVRGDSTTVGARRVPLRILGRCIRLVFTRTDSCVVQFAQHNVARTSRYPVAHGQDTHVELRRRAPCRHGGSWTRCVEPRRYQDPGTLLGIRSFCQLPSSSGWSKSENCGRLPFSARPATHMAAPPPMRRTALPPLAADRAPPQSVIQVAQGHDAGMQRAMEVLLGSLPGDDAQVEMARHITTLPLRMGGLGLRSARRWRQQHSGLRGRMHCPCCSNAFLS